MPQKKAQFKIVDLIVWILCPYCGSEQQSPNYPDSPGWDHKDVKQIGESTKVTCRKCHQRFPLPAQLFTLMPG